MPIYEYRCQTCNEVFEVRQKFSDEPIATHAVCGGHAKRLLSTPQFHFKGSGFYITDYAKAGSKQDGSKTETKSESKTETKTESKPAASAPAATTTKND